MRTTIVLFALACLIVTTRASDNAYEGLVTSARQFAAESSWSKARDAFSAAHKLAPTTADRERCSLGIIEASWRAAFKPSDWAAQEAQRKREIAEYDSLLGAYDKGRPCDAFWIEIIESRACSYDRFDPNKAWADRLAIADFLGGKPPSIEAVAQYVRFIKKIAESNGIPEELTHLFNTHLEAALRISPDRETQAYLKLLVTLRLQTARYPTQNSVSPFTEAIEIAKGTHFETPALVWDFLWRADADQLPKKTPDDVPDFPVWLAQLDELRARLPETPSTPQEVAAGKALDERKLNWTKPIIDLRAPTFAVPGESITVDYGAAEYTSLTFRLYRHSLETWRSDFKKKGSRDQPISSSAELIQSWSIPLTKTQDHAWETGTLPLSSAISSGVYTLVAQGNGESSPSKDRRLDIIVSRIGATLIAGEHSDVVGYIYDQTTKAPLANAELSIIWADSAIAPFTVHSDSEGHVTLKDLPLVPRGEDWSDLLLMVNGNPVSISLDNYILRARFPTSKTVADIVFDRPLYRPGDTVNWRIVVRNDDGRKYSLPEEPLKLFIKLNDTLLVDGEALALNAFGTAHGHLTLPAIARPGYADIRMGTDEKNHSYVSGFRVDNIVPPAIKADIVLTSTPDSFRPGSTARFKVQATYLSGGAVVGAAVNCTLAIFDSEMDKDGSSSEKQRFDKWVKMESKPRTGITDASGSAEFSLVVPAMLAGKRVSGAIRVQVLPEGGSPISTSNGFAISDVGYSTFANAENLVWAHPNQPTELKFSLIDGLYRRCRFEGKAEIIELRWMEAWLDADKKAVSASDLTAKRRQKGRDFRYDHDGWTKLYGSYVEHKIATIPVRADDSGTLRVPFTFGTSGCYAVRILSEKGPVSKVPIEPQIIVADEATRSLSIDPEQCLLLSENRLVGAPAQQLLAIFPEGETEGVFAIGDQTTTTLKRVSLKGNCGIIAVPPTVGPSEVWAAPLGYSKYHWPRVRFDNSPSTAIRCEILPQSPESRPGQSVTIAIHASSSSKPLQHSELSITATDEALFRLSRKKETKHGFLRYPPSISASEDKLRCERYWAESNIEKFKTAGPLKDPRADFSEILSGKAHAIIQTFGLDGGLANQSGAREPGLADYKSVDNRQIQIRRHFSSTACWEPSIVTDAKGEARVTFTYPDNLTQWRLSAYAVGEDLNSFGTATAFTRTSLPFQARLQLPRFLIAGDTAEVSAMLVNRTDKDISASAALALEGSVSADNAAMNRAAIIVQKQAESHVGWDIHAAQSGNAKISLTAHAGAEGDAMELPLPLLKDGIEQNTSVCAKLGSKSRTCSFTLPLPDPLDPAQTQVTVQLSAGYADALLDALPYLIDYPYGCVEQTTSRFLPAVVVRRLLQTLGLPADVVENRIQKNETSTDSVRRAKTAGLSRLRHPAPWVESR